MKFAVSLLQPNTSTKWQSNSLLVATQQNIVSLLQFWRQLMLLTNSTKLRSIAVQLYLKARLKKRLGNIFSVKKPRVLHFMTFKSFAKVSDNFLSVTSWNNSQMTGLQKSEMSSTKKELTKLKFTTQTSNLILSLLLKRIRDLKTSSSRLKKFLKGLDVTVMLVSKNGSLRLFLKAKKDTKLVNSLSNGLRVKFKDKTLRLLRCATMKKRKKGLLKQGPKSVKSTKIERKRKEWLRRKMHQFRMQSSKKRNLKLIWSPKTVRNKLLKNSLKVLHGYMGQWLPLQLLLELLLTT